MSKRAEMTKWERFYYWPLGKEFLTSPKGRLIKELVDIFGMVITATFGGMFLTLAMVTKDREGLFFTYSNSGLRYQHIMMGVALILLALAIGIVRRIILAPPAVDASGE